MPQEKLGTYYLGLTLKNPQILSRIKKYTGLIEINTGLRFSKAEEEHVTIIPPFRTTYEVASHLNLRCAASTLRSRHPLVTTVFSVTALTQLSWGNDKIICLPVRVFAETKGFPSFSRYVETLRKDVTSILPFSWKSDSPTTFTPHITVAIIKDTLDGNREYHLREIMEESAYEPPIYFRATYPTLYAKYEEGWGDFRDDPTAI